MKKILSVMLIVLFMAFGTAYAKDIQLGVELEFDPDFNEDTTEFALFYQNETNPNVLVEVTRISDSTVRQFDTPIFDLAPGKTSQFFLAAVYDDGTIDMSDPGFPYKFTGKPTIIRLIKR